jgi:glutathione S-transferase
MHAGFGGLRGDCPMQLIHQYQNFTPSDKVLADLARIETLWSLARDTFGTDTPWLFGDYSLADVFYAPVAARVAGYGLPVSKAAQAYVMAHLNDPAFQKWRAEGAKKYYDPVPYAMDLKTGPWPV